MSSSFKRRGTKKTSASSGIVSPASISSTDSDGLTNSTTSSSSSSASSLQQHHPRTLSSSLLPGTRPWTSNLTVTSFGLREMDSFLFSPGGGGGKDGGGGGGQPLQTMVLLEEDRLTDDLSRALCRYWCAEGIAQRQMVMMPSLLHSAEESLQLLDDADGVDGHINNTEGSTPEELHEFVLSLPRNLHRDKLRSKSTTKKQSSSDTTTSFGADERMSNHDREAITAIVEEDEHDEDEDDIDDDDHGHRDQTPNTTTTSDEGLINAWQYRKSIQVARSGIANQIGNDVGLEAGAGDGIYCHSYNLSQRMWDQFAPNDTNDDDGRQHDNPLVTNTRIVDCSRSFITPKFAGDKSLHNQHQGMALFCTLWKHLQSELSTNRNRVIRLFIHRLPVGQGCIAMPLLMTKIRKDNLPVVVLVTIRPWKWLTTPTAKNSNTSNKIDTLLSLRNTADTALSLDAFSSLRTPPPPEFSLLQGILTVHKCATSTTAHYTDTVTNKRPLADRFGVKRDGRKVTVQLLHLPPEEYSKGGSSTGGGDRSGGGHTAAAAAAGIKHTDKHHHGHDNTSASAAGMGCSSFGGGGPSLEF